MSWRRLPDWAQLGLVLFFELGLVALAGWAVALGAMWLDRAK